MKHKPFLFSITLWAATALVLVFLFVRGSTGVATDQRTAVLLNPAEKDLILAEMRVLLGAVHGTVRGLRTGNRAEMAKSLRAAGMVQAADVKPGLMAKLPLTFKQSGMSVHTDFDQMALAVEAGASDREILERLDSVLGRCVACHAGYRLEAK